MLEGVPPPLPPELRALVKQVQTMLGVVVGEAAGAELFDVVEAVRLEMVRFRDSSDARTQGRALAAAQRLLADLPPARRLLVARAYTMYLELVNVCENAWRTYRLRVAARERTREAPERARLLLVLTAHPTESRSPENIRLVRRVQNHLVDALEARGATDAARLHHLLHAAWRVGTHPPHKPTVEDEARHLLSLLTDPILEELLELRALGHDVRLRTWVGGDKDGHPGVGPDQTLASLSLSRKRLLGFVQSRIVPAVDADARLFGHAGLDVAITTLRRQVDALTEVAADDGGRLVDLRAGIEAARLGYRRQAGAEHPDLLRLVTLLDLFPGLVVPLELREERGLFASDAPIAAMLAVVRDVARGGDVGWYARGLVVSMAGAARDILEAGACVATVFGQDALPVIPLFELPPVLERATSILAEAWQAAPWRAAVRHHGYLEVMLGYSDTSKRMGVVASRLHLHDAMEAVAAWGAREDVPIVFFHGSGGSVGRGGGTIAEQAATWPAAGIKTLKQTVQGEMVERTLASPEILRRLVERVAVVQARPPGYLRAGKLLRELAAHAQLAFVDMVSQREFLDLMSDATPYARLGALTIGSRPSRRGGRATDLEGLRAIPWVLCWTQTRYLLHVWLGVGTAWRRLKAAPGAQARLRRAVRTDPLLRAVVRQLGFTLAKTEPRIWQEYVRRLAPAASRALVRQLERERADALDLVRCATPAGALLPDRPWLYESIRYRAPMIHPLNLLQIDVLQRPRLRASDEALLRETITGIAAGMLTTG
jgi:phosphoenolpyruvate carboxylase